MNKAPILPNEVGRQQALAEYNLLNTLLEEEYDAITHIASEICRTPISAITLIADEKQVWFKARQRMAIEGAPRDLVFCAHAIAQPDPVMVVGDTRLDARFSDNPFVIGDAKLLFYAGVPLVNKDGFALGTLCVMDNRPRQLTESQLLALKALGQWVMTHFELRKTRIELDQSRRDLRQSLQSGSETASDNERTSPVSNDLTQQVQALQKALGAFLETTQA